jgi:hypothetical protein
MYTKSRFSSRCKMYPAEVRSLSTFDTDMPLCNDITVSIHFPLPEQLKRAGLDLGCKVHHTVMYIHWYKIRKKEKKDNIEKIIKIIT